MKINDEIVIIGGSIGNYASIEAMHADFPLSISCEVVNKKAHISINGTIWAFSNSSAQFQRQIDKLIADGIKDVHVFVNTPGGSVFEANEIIDIIQRFEGKITGEGGILVASAGTAIAIHLRDFSQPSNGHFMIHQPIAGLNGNVNQIESGLKLLKSVTNQYLSDYSDKTGMTVAEIGKLWAKGDFWMTAQEAKDKGFIESVRKKKHINKQVQAIFTACAAPIIPEITNFNPKNNQQIPNKETMKITATMLVMLGMSESSDETQVEAAFKAVFDKAKELDALKATIQKEKAQSEMSQITSLLNEAVKDKRISEDYRAGFEAKFKTNFNAAKTELEAIKKPQKASDGIQENGDGTIAADRKDWTYADWAEREKKGLMAMVKTNPDAFKKLFKSEYNEEPNMEMFK